MIDLVKHLPAPGLLSQSPAAAASTGADVEGVCDSEARQKKEEKDSDERKERFGDILHGKLVFPWQSQKS